MRLAEGPELRPGLIYAAPTGTPLDSTAGPRYFGDNVKCCTIWIKDPETGTETMLTDSRSQIICRPGS